MFSYFLFYFESKKVKSRKKQPQLHLNKATVNCVKSGLFFHGLCLLIPELRDIFDTKMLSVVTNILNFGKNASEYPKTRYVDK